MKPVIALYNLPSTSLNRGSTEYLGLRDKCIGCGHVVSGQFGATIRRGQFGANYNINFIENSAFTQRYFFVNPASMSAIFFFYQSSFYFANICYQSRFYFSRIFHQSRSHFTNILFINLASISAIFFSSIPLPMLFSPIPLLFHQYRYRQSRFYFSSIFHQSRFHFSNILPTHPASILAIFFYQSRFHFSKIFHQFITVTHNFLYQMCLLIEYTKLQLYTITKLYNVYLKTGKCC